MVDDRPISGQPGTAPGVYGMRITGIPEQTPGLMPVPSSWPKMHIELQNGTAARAEPPGTVRFSADEGEVWLPGGDRIELRRSPLTVRFATHEPLREEALLHPLLGLPAAIANHWLGRQPLHGGAFVHEARAWALLGVRGAGKSATLGCLLRNGHAIVTDDVLIVDGTSVVAGPRFVDLRPDAARLFGGEPVGLLGSRRRWRLRPDAVPASMHLAGFAVLEWGKSTILEPLDPATRLRTLIANSVFRPNRAAAGALLELAALPAWRFVRPPGIDELRRLTHQLVEAMAG